MSNQQMFQPEEQRQQRDRYADRYEEQSSNIGVESYRQSQTRREQQEQPVEGSYSPSYQAGYSGEPIYGPSAPSMEGEKIQPRADMKTKKKGGWGWLIAIIIIIALLGGGGGIMNRGGFDGSFSDNSPASEAINPIAVGAAPTVSIVNTLGDIKIVTGDFNTVQINATKRVSGFNGDVNELNVKADYISATNTVMVTVEGERGGNFFDWQNVDLEITMPSTGNIDIKSTSGDVTINDVNGKLTLNTISGDVEINNSVLGEGSILESTSGDIRLEDTVLKGNTTMTSTSGNIRFQGLLDPQSNTTMRTISGDVNVELPRDATFDLNTKTTSGDIDNDFSNSASGSGSQTILDITTTSGDINIRD